MNIFTARENFKDEFIQGHRQCQNCMKFLHHQVALVRQWNNKKGQQSIALCDDECWSTYDHNFWLERRAKQEYFAGNEDVAEVYYDSRLEIK